MQKNTIYKATMSPDPLGPTKKLLSRALSSAPRLNIERAYYFTQSLKETEGLPLTLRWARAMVNVMDSMEIHILPEERIVGRFGDGNRYGIFYPELEGSFFAQGKKRCINSEAVQYLSAADIDIIQQDLLPFWNGHTYHEGMVAMLTPELKKLMYLNDDIFSPTFIIQETATLRHSLQWVLDYKKVLQHGFVAIEKEAHEQRASVKEETEGHAFYTGVMELCQGIRRFAERYAVHAEHLASIESSVARRQELHDIATRCRRVPYFPARNFPEAVQAQWFTQFISRIEQLHGANISNGRIDQYFWPYYQRDMESGTLHKQEAKEFLNHLWCNMAQILRVQTTPSGEKFYENCAHWESTTIGGQLVEGKDATNPLSFLVLETTMDFPLDYPYLSVRIHKNTPETLLHAIARALRQGKGVPVLINDEEIIPILKKRGASHEEALDYTPSGYSEVRLMNRNTYLVGTTWLNLLAVLEMALFNGRCSSSPVECVALETGDAAHFTSFETFCEAFFKQLDYVQDAIYTQQTIVERIRYQHVASPFLSSLHTLCMRHGMDINSGAIPEGLSIGGITGVTGLATVVDSLAVIKRLVFDEKSISLPELIQAIVSNFEGKEPLRQRCLRCPKYGTADALTISLAKKIDHHLITQCHSRRNIYGGRPEIFYVPIMAHTAMGRISGATPDGRRAGEGLSFGAGATQGSAIQGPTVTLAAEKATKNPELCPLGARVIDINFCPRTIQGETGLAMLRTLIRSWCRQRHWYLRIHTYDQKDLALLKNNPEKFRDIPLREPGFNGHRSFISSTVTEHMFAPTYRKEVSDGAIFRV